jgi:uncharacterized protein (DUF1697 family)
MNSKKEKYVAFLRGINVGGHHKVPMAELRKELEKMNFENVITLLNSGNILFDGNADDLEHIEKKMAAHLERAFGFPIPTIIRKAEMINRWLEDDPFKEVILTKDIRLYVTFLKEDKEFDFQLPWTSEDQSYKIISKQEKNILSILDLTISKTPKAMLILEKSVGKDITTRNWNTIIRLGKKLASK